MLNTSVVARAIRFASTVALLIPGVAAAQDLQTRGGAWQLRIPGGALIATGEQRDHLRSAQLSAIQISRKVGLGLAVTGTFGWARSRDLTAIDTPKLDVFTSDIGLEACSREWRTGESLSLSTFAGFGGGARSYNYRKLDVDATNNLAGYVAVGGEAGMGRFSLRLEARDYATGFKPLVGGGKSEARNDVVIMAALGFKRRAAEAR